MHSRCSTAMFTSHNVHDVFSSASDTENCSRTSRRDRNAPIESLLHVLRIDRFVNAITGNGNKSGTGALQRLHLPEQRTVDDSRVSNYQSASVTSHRTARQFSVRHRLVLTGSVGCDTLRNHHSCIGNTSSIA